MNQRIIILVIQSKHSLRRQSMVLKKRQSFECEVCRNNYFLLETLHYHKKTDHNVNDNNVNDIEFEFGSNVLQQSTPTVESQLTLQLSKRQAMVTSKPIPVFK